MKRKPKKPTITLWAFWELSKKQQRAVRDFMEREEPHRHDFEEYNYTVIEPGAVDWLDIKTIRLEDNGHAAGDDAAGDALKTALERTVAQGAWDKGEDES